MGILIALATFFGTGTLIAHVIREIEFKTIGSRWLKSLQPGFLENASSFTVSIDPTSKTYVTEQQHRYKISKENDDWKMECYWTGEDTPFLTLYDGTTTRDFFNEKELFGLGGYISLSKEKRNKAYRTIRSEFLRELEKEPFKSSRKKESNEVLKIRNGRCIWTVSEETIRFQLDKWDSYTYKKESDIETYGFIRNDIEMYRISRNGKTNEITELYIEPNVLKSIQNIDEFTREQEGIWFEMKKAILQNAKKEKELKERLEKKSREEKNLKKDIKEIPNNQWKIYKNTILEHANECSRHMEFLSEEDQFYLQHTLHKRLKEIESYIQIDSNVKNLDSICQNILLRISKIENEIQTQLDRGIEKINRLTTLDI